jgi:hypothetical protein
LPYSVVVFAIALRITLASLCVLAFNSFKIALQIKLITWVRHQI